MAEYSDAVAAARARRAAKAGAASKRDQWFIKEAVQKVAIPMQQRVKIATEYLRSKIVKNLSVPVIKTVVSVGKQPRNDAGHFQARRRVTRVSGRSKPGEFPRADTTLLMKSIIGETTIDADGNAHGYVGTPVDYGVILELKMQRSFLRRTMHEERAKIQAILSGPIQ